MIKEYLECGKIVTTHGIKGEVKIEPWAENAEFLKEFKRFYLKNGEKEMKIKSSRIHKNSLLAVFESVESMDDAEKLRGSVIYIKRSDANLPEGKYFWQDLIGMKVVDVDDENIFYGDITDISNIPGANDVYYLKKGGKEYLIPGVKDIVKKTDLENNIMYISPLEGLFDDED